MAEIWNGIGGRRTGCVVSQHGVLWYVLTAVYVCGMLYRVRLKNNIRQYRKKMMCFAIIAFLWGGMASVGIFYQRGKLGRMVQTVLEKEPKVQSTAIKQMRHKAKELLKKVPEN